MVITRHNDNRLSVWCSTSDEFGGVREAADNDDVDEMLDIRMGLAKTSTEKYNAMIRTACKDSRIRGLTMFYGAARTGRWASRLVQMQNLPQNKMPERDLDTARQLVRVGDLRPSI